MTGGTAFGVYAPRRDNRKTSADEGVVAAGLAGGSPIYGNSGQKSGRKIIETTSKTTVSRAPTRA
jgi:hypothetical protein